MSNTTIYTGIWQNHSQPGWKGSTLTLETRTAALLISALATFVTLVGARFWAIVSFAIHQIRASPDEKDGVYHQHQVIYRNGFSSLSAAWKAIQISWAWRRRAHCNIGRMFMAILPPLLCFIGFAAASVLSAKVAAPPTAASQVKLRSKNCGYLDFRKNSDAIGTVRQNDSLLFETYWVNQAVVARNYARSCYDSNPQALASCNVYAARTLPYDTNDKTACPFGGHRCVLGDNGAFEMQTHWLDSHQHFGINAPKEDRVEWRRKTTCSVLNVTDLVTSVVTTAGTVHIWHLGYIGPLTARSNETFHYNENAANFGLGYYIEPNVAVNQDPYPGWIPTPDLAHIDADVSIFYLAQNSVVYPYAIDDPLFSAHRRFFGRLTNPTDAVYASDNLVSVLACIDQAQFRNPTTNISTPFSGLQILTNNSFSIGLNPRQIATSGRFIMPTEDALIEDSVNGLGAMSLKAQDSVFLTQSAGLPDYQWKVELQGWFDTALARLQLSILAFASKEVETLLPIANLTMTEINIAETRAMCDNQIIMAVGNYQSFSMMGIEIIAGVGFFIILLSFCIEGIVGFFQRRWGSQEYKLEQWTTDAVLQLQRMAVDYAKVDEWEKMDGTVPVTSPGMIWSS